MGQDESKSLKFQRLAEARVNRAIRDVQLVGNLANPSTYEWTQGEVHQMFKALNAELKLAKSRFDSAASGSSKSFTFK